MFDREKFLAAQKRNQENNPFVKVEDGFYICDLTNATIGKTKNTNKDQVVFEWEITDDNDAFVGKKQWQNITFDTDQGYDILVITLSQLKVSPEMFATDPEKTLDSLIGTKAKLQISTNKSNADFSDYRIKKVITHSNNPRTEALTQQPDLQIQSSPTKVEDQIQLTKGMPVNYTKDGKQITGKLDAYFAETEMCTILKQDGTADLVKLADISPVLPGETTPFETKASETKAPSNPVVVEEIEEIDNPTPKLKIKPELGMTVSGMYTDPAGNARQVNGVVHKIKEGGIIVIAEGGKGYPCKEDTVEVKLPH